MNKQELIELLTREGYSELIVSAFQNVEREQFVPDNLKESAYLNSALPTQEGQTISQPSCIAMMLEMLELEKLNKKDKNVKILEIGSGTGYVLALLNQILPNAKLYGIEIKKSLAYNSKKLLKNIKNIEIINKSGINGHKKPAPYDLILISASAPSKEIVDNLIPQLKNYGIIVSPVGYDIVRIKKGKNRVEKSVMKNAVSFVPLVE